MSQQNLVLYEMQQALFRGRYYRASNKTAYDFSGVAKALQENPLLIDSQDENGDTVLHILAKNQDKEFNGISFKRLFKMGANPFIQNKDGLTPRGLVSLRSFPDAYGKLASYESAFQAAKMGLALKALKDIINYQSYTTDNGCTIGPEERGYQAKIVTTATLMIDSIAYSLCGNQRV